MIDLSRRLLAGRYRLEGALGRGGMAVVYAAQDLRLDRRVAVKVMPVAAAEPAERHRFVREARSAAGLSHPNAVSVFDAGESDDHLYLVMEFVAGRTLEDLLAERGPLEPAQATEIITPVLAALLGHAHAAGIVHRDVKPSNIMVSDDGTVKLLDFGIARRFDDLAGAITVEGQMVGTPKYLAPEQVEGGPVSPATDLYAVGVVLFEMLTGTVPFDGDSAVSTALARLRTPAPDVRSRRPDVPPELAAVVRRAMARAPAERFEDAVAMQAALVRSPTGWTTVVASPTVPLQPTQVLPVRRWPRGRVLRLVAVVGAIVLVAGLLAWYTARGDSGQSPPAAPASSSPVTTVAPASIAPSTIAGVIATLQADPEAYGQHTDEIVNELVKIQRGDASGERAATLLGTVTRWTENGEVTPAVLALLGPVLLPLTTSPPSTAADGGDGGGNGKKKGKGKGDG